MRKRNKYLLFALPSFLLIAVVVLIPVGYAVYYSFFNYKMGIKPSFNGLTNYINVLKSVEFWNAMKFSMIFTIASVALEFMLGMGIALLLDNIKRGRKVLSIVIYLPYFITAAAAGVIFRWMFMAGWGIISQLLTPMGIDPPHWFDSSFWATVGVIIAEVWQYTTFAIIILYAGLQSIPMDQIEAAKIDGANPVAIFFNVKLPNLRHLITLILMMRTMDAFRLFDRINVTTGGGPGTSTETLAIFNYRIAFKMLRIGQGSAVGVLTMIALSIPILLLNRAMRSKEVD